MKNVKINPEFEDLYSPETFIVHLENLKKEGEIKGNPFPVEVFPTQIQEIIRATNESLNFPIDYIGASILFAVSVAIGNTVRIEIMKGFDQNAVLYIAIVGPPGTNKSHPLSFALRPLEERDNLKYKEYQKDKQEFDKVEHLSKKERESQKNNKFKRPVWKQCLVTDFTPEALIDVHKYIERGVGVYSDELASWFKNFDRYNKGSEEQFWLSVWSGKPIRINRKTSEPTYLSMPFISVAGTIQTAILNELAKNRTENGFLDRLLFVMPDNLKKKYWSEKELDPVIIENWQNIINKLLDISVILDDTETIIPEILKFTPEAKKRLFDWQKEITDKSNNADNEAISGIYAKIELYALRLALCLEMMFFACGDSDKQVVGVEAVKGALKLVEYFKNSAIQVHSILSNTDPLAKLPTDKQNLYNSLPEYFTTKEGLNVAEDMGIPERTFKDFISKRELFIRTKRGEYEKLL